MAQTQTKSTSGFPWSVAAGAAATLFQPNFHIGYGSMSNAPPMQNTASQTTAQTTQFVDERLLDAKLEAVEARTDLKFAQLLGEIRLVGEKITSLEARVGSLDAKIESVDGHTRAGKRDIIIAVIASALAIVGLAWAGVQIFQGGLGLSAGAFQAGLDAAGAARNADTQGSDRSGRDL